MIKQRFSDSSFLVASKRFLAPADGEIEALQVPRGHFIEEVWVELTNGAAAGTATFNAGIKGGDADGLIVVTGADKADGSVVSSKGAQGGAQGDGIYCSVGTILTLTVAIGNSATQGDFVVYARYTNITR